MLYTQSMHQYIIMVILHTWYRPHTFCLYCLTIQVQTFSTQAAVSTTPDQLNSISVIPHPSSTSPTLHSIYAISVSDIQNQLRTCPSNSFSRGFQIVSLDSTYFYQIFLYRSYKTLSVLVSTLVISGIFCCYVNLKVMPDHDLCL